MDVKFSGISTGALLITTPCHVCPDSLLHSSEFFAKSYWDAFIIPEPLLQHSQPGGFLEAFHAEAIILKQCNIADYEFNSTVIQSRACAFTKTTIRRKRSHVTLYNEQLAEFKLT
jgi:hypothetical protein